jgi:hypothetical protein
MPLDPVLARLPVIGPAMAAEDRNIAATDANVQRGLGLSRLESAFREAEMQKKARAELDALGPTPTEDQLILWGARYSSPKDVLHWKQQAQNVKLHEATTKEATATRLQQIARQFEMNYALRLQNAKDAREQNAIKNEFRQKQLLLNAEAARQGGVKLFWETGDASGMRPVDVNVPMPQAPQTQQITAPGLSPGNMAAVQAIGAAGGGRMTLDEPYQPGPSVELAPQAQAPVQAPQQGGFAPAPVPTPAPTPAADPFFHPAMPPEIAKLPPKDRKAWIADFEGQKSQEKFAKDTSAYQTGLAAYKRLEGQIEQVKAAKLGRITGLAGVIPNVPGQAGAVAQNRLEDLKNRVMVDTLRDLKAMSAQGASSFGALTEKEGERLESYLGRLNRSVDEKEIRRILEEIATFTKEAKERLTKAYTEAHRTRLGTPGVRAGAARNQLLEAADAIVGR